LPAPASLFHRRFDAPQQLAFGFAATDGEHAMAGNGAQRFGELEVILELRFVALLLGDHAALHHTLGACDFTHPAADHGVFGDLFGQDVTRTLQRRFGGGHFARLAVGFGENELRRLGERGCIVECTIPQRLGERTEPAFARDHRTRAALRLERQIEIFERLLRVCRHDGGLERVIELALFIDALDDGRTTVFHLLQILGALTHVAELHFVEPARHFLAVSGNEGERGALGEEGKGPLHLLRVQRQFGRHARHEGGGECIEGWGSHRRGFYVR
jgi:hypothetical protein